MASNKNQHFVPRCYLRQFATLGNEAAVCLYNIDREKPVPIAPIKHQCSGDYFYGKDELLENAIQSVEGPFGSAAKSIQAPGYRLTAIHQVILQTFWLMQHLRTEAAAKRGVEITEEIGSVVGMPGEEFNMQIRDAVQMAMMAFAHEIRVVSDLKICLVKNRTEVPFITSDNPAVATNRWHLLNRRRCGLSFGLRSSGLITLLPISPRVMCVGYDGDVYSISHENGWAEVRSTADVEAFNQHQFLNCNANVYFNDVQYAGMVDAAFKRVKGLRLKSFHRVNYAVPDLVEDGHTRYRVVDRARAEGDGEALIHTQRVYPAPSAWPRQISWRHKGAVYTNGTGVGYLRQYWAERTGGRPFTREFP